MTAAEILTKLSPGETLGEYALRLEEDAGGERAAILQRLSGMLEVMETR